VIDFNKAFNISDIIEIIKKDMENIIFINRKEK